MAATGATSSWFLAAALLTSSCGAETVIPATGAFCVSAREAAFNVTAFSGYERVECAGPRGCFASVIQDDGRIKTVGIVCDRRAAADAGAIDARE